MFLGQFERSVDDKGRLALPPELRVGLGTGAVLTRSFDECLCIYPAQTWGNLAQAIDDLPDARYEARVAARSVFSGAVPCALDRQGRLSIPAFLRDHAGLIGDAIIVGVWSRIEVWSTDHWQREREKFELERESLPETFSASHA